MKTIFLLCCCCIIAECFAKTITVGKGKNYSTIQEALVYCIDGDTVLVFPGLYKEGNISIQKAIFFIGIQYPVLDGQKKFEILSIRSNRVEVNGFSLQHSGYGTLDDPGAIKVYNSNNITICNNILDDNFFGIYIQYGKNCLIKNNQIKAYGIEEQQIGNGIHCWKSDSLQIIGNTVSGHRDGIYFEFVTGSIIWRNTSTKNIRYGLHFMFSNNDAYITNIFKNNGAGVAVMFSKEVKMFNNFFDENWGESAYGILLKEISDGYMLGNHFLKNTAAIYLEGASRMVIENNIFDFNGWAMRIQASCMDNTILHNNFTGNSFDVSTNGSLVLNHFDSNFWDKYEGYDLNRDNIGDIPFHPLSIYAMMVEKNPPAILLHHSFMVQLLDQSEKLLPSITPEDFVDLHPLMHPLPL